MFLCDRTRLETGREIGGSDTRQGVGAEVELATAAWRSKPPYMGCLHYRSVEQAPNCNQDLKIKKEERSLKNRDVGPLFQSNCLQFLNSL